MIQVPLKTIHMSQDIKYAWIGKDTVAENNIILTNPSLFKAMAFHFSISS